MGTGAVGIHNLYSEYKVINPNIPFYIKDPQENPFRKKENLNVRLDQIDPILAQRMREISKSISNISEIKHLKNTAHLIREFISEFLQLCDPLNNVKKMSWVELTIIKKPKHISRVIFAIVGSNPLFDTSKSINEPFIDIAKKYRKLYNYLNGLAHLRKKTFEQHKRMLIKTYFDQLLEYTEIILNLRELYFIIS